MNPSTETLIQQVGALTTLCVLLLTLAVVVLRLFALPLALAAIVLDKSADLAARPLSYSPASSTGRRYSR